MEEGREHRRNKQTVNIGPSILLFRSPLLLWRKESSVLNVRHMEQQIFLAKLSQSPFPWQPLAPRKGTKHKEILYAICGHQKKKKKPCPFPHSQGCGNQDITWGRIVTCPGHLDESLLFYLGSSQTSLWLKPLSGVFPHTLSDPREPLKSAPGVKHHALNIYNQP